MAFADPGVTSLLAHLLVAQAACAGIPVATHTAGTATQLHCAAHPLEIAYNRTLDVDAREPGAAAALLARARLHGPRPLLEMLPESLGAATRAELAALGLAPLWSVVMLHLDLRSLPDTPASTVPVRDAAPAEAAAFGALAVRAYGPPPPGFPAPDEAAKERRWAAFCRLGRARCFFAERDGAPVAIGMFVREGEAALVDGAATLAEHRGRGCQSALLAHRFREARAEGATVAITRAAASSASRRNLERAGMRVVQEREVWGLPG